MSFVSELPASMRRHGTKVQERAGLQGRGKVQSLGVLTYACASGRLGREDKKKSYGETWGQRQISQVCLLLKLPGDRGR